MAYPPSVERLPLARRRGGQSKSRKKLLPGEESLPDPTDTKPDVGIGGPILDFGRPGGVRLERKRHGWDWSWLAEEIEGRS
jgi:hypothetical protein